MSMTSRERILATIAGEPTDHAPLGFLLFSELQGRSAGERDFIRRQVDLGIDAVAALPDPAWGFHPDVTSEVTRLPGEVHPLLRKVYHTPAGDLETVVEVSDDWPHGDDIPLMSDYVIPRAKKFLVTSADDLAPLGYLLQGPTDEAIAQWREKVRATQQLADEFHLATRGAFNRLSDMICWLCGCEQFAVLGRTDPELFRRLISLIAAWQERFIEIFLEARPDLLVDAQWYATTFLSPRFYDEFLGAALKRRVDMAHAAGSAFCVVATTSVMPFFGNLKRLGIDALFGVDPVQGGWDLSRTKAELGDEVTLWGGINGYLHIVDGTPEQVRAATETAMRLLAPGGRFILAPVDNVRIDGPRTPEAWRRAWANVQAMVEAWKRLR